jgi:hypothetical protein
MANYINNKVFFQALVEYKNKVNDFNNGLLKTKPKIPEFIGQCIVLLAEKMATSGSFVNYTWRDEMVEDGIENCIRYIDNFNPEKSQNAFGYFSLIIHNAFLRRIATEKEQLYAKFKSFRTNFAAEELDHTIVRGLTPDYIDQYILDYEASMARKKEKAAKRAAEVAAAKAAEVAAAKATPAQSA